jgi:hypothetical protein
MKPITDDNGTLRIFGVDRFDGHKPWLDAYPEGYTANRWHVARRWVFMRRKQPIS